MGSARGGLPRGQGRGQPHGGDDRRCRSSWLVDRAAINPEIGTLSGKAVAKLAGLAPLARDSGQRAGKRAVRGGRSGIRSILFLVADVVRRHEPDFQAFHRKLSAAGKPKKAIRIALARKLLVRLNAKARDARRQLAPT